MNIHLYRYNQEMNEPKKTQVSTMSLSGTFRFPLDILNPKIDIHLSKTGTTSLANLQLYNYVCIPDIGRGYFIDDYVINGATNSDVMVTLYLNIDVLGTYYNYLKTCNAYVARCEKTYDPTVYDEVMPVKANKQISYTPLEGQLYDRVYPYAGFLLSVITNDTTETDIGGYYNQTGDIKTIDYSTANAGANCKYYLIYYFQLKYLIDAVVDNDTLKGYIKYLGYLPIQHNSLYEYETQTGADAYKIKIGNTTVTLGTGGTSPAVFKNIGKLARIATLQLELDNNYTNYSQFLKIELLIPFYGLVELNYEDVNNKTIRVDLAICYDNGEATVYIWNETDNVIIFSAPCQFGYRIALSSTNLLEWTTVKDNLQRTGVSRAISSAVTGLTGVGFMTNPFTFPMGASMTLGAGVGAMETAVDIYNKNASNYHTAKAEPSGNINGAFTRYEVILKLTRTLPLLYGDTAYAHAVGLPLYKTVTINSLDTKGYTVVKDIKLDGAIENGNTTIASMVSGRCRATKAEIDMLYEKVKGGIIL